MAKLSGLGGRLYSGETSFNIVENRKRWYSFSAVFIIASIFALGVQGLHLGIEFKGGASFTVNKASATIQEAREAVEAYTELTVAQTTYAMALDEFPVNEIELGTSPVNSITSIMYTDTNGATQTLNANQYIFDSYSNPAKIFPVTIWPHTKIIPNAVIVRFAAGFTDGLSPNA